MESEPGSRYSIRACVGCTTGHFFWCKIAVQPLPCPCSRWVPTHPHCWLWHSNLGRGEEQQMRWSQPTSFWTAPGSQPRGTASMTCESHSTLEVVWILYRKHGHLRVTAEGVCGDNQEGVNKVWMGEASATSLPQREGGYDKSKVGSLSGKLTPNCDTSQEWVGSEVSRGQGDADFQKVGGEMSHADNSKPARRKLST